MGKIEFTISSGEIFFYFWKPSDGIVVAWLVKLGPCALQFEVQILTWGCATNENTGGPDSHSGEEVWYSTLQSSLLLSQESQDWLSPKSSVLTSLVSLHKVQQAWWYSSGLQPARLLGLWGFSRQECWSGLPCPPPGDLSNPGIEPRSLALQADSLPAKLPRKPKRYH